MSKLVQKRLDNDDAFSCVPKIRLFEAIEALAELTERQIHTKGHWQSALREQCLTQTRYFSQVPTAAAIYPVPFANLPPPRS